MSALITHNDLNNGVATRCPVCTLEVEYIDVFTQLNDFVKCGNCESQNMMRDRDTEITVKNFIQINLG